MTVTLVQTAAWCESSHTCPLDVDCGNCTRCEEPVGTLLDEDMGGFHRMHLDIDTGAALLSYCEDCAEVAS